MLSALEDLYFVVARNPVEAAAGTHLTALAASVTGRQPDVDSLQRAMDKASRLISGPLAPRVLLDLIRLVAREPRREPPPLPPPQDYVAA